MPTEDTKENRSDNQNDVETTRSGNDKSQKQEGNDPAERRKWMHGYELLVRKVGAIERDCTIPRDLGSVTKELMAEKGQLEEDCRHSRTEIREDIDRVSSLVQGVEEMLGQARPATEFVQALSTAMDSIENEVVSIKKSQRDAFDDLLRSDRLLSRDLELMIERMNSAAWAGTSDHTTSKATPHQKQNPTWVGSCKGGGSGLLPEVLEYDEYLEMHGETRGWHNEDHREFMRVLKVCNGDYSVAIEMCCDEMIGYTRADIVAHARWHSVLIDLANQKRVAIATWRAEKEAQRVKRVQEASFESEAARQALAESQQKQTKERLKREVQRELVKEWHHTKQREASKQRSEKEEKIRLDRDRKMQATKRKQEVNKARVQAYKENKMAARKAAEEAAVAAKAAMKQISVPSSQCVERMKQRNDMMVRKKQLRQEEIQRQDKERQNRLDKLKKKVQVNVDRDPNRVLKSTASVLNKHLAEQEEECRPQTSGFIRNVQHKARPMWCKGHNI